VGAVEDKWKKPSRMPADAIFPAGRWRRWLLPARDALVHGGRDLRRGARYLGRGWNRDRSKAAWNLVSTHGECFIGLSRLGISSSNGMLSMGDDPDDLVIAAVSCSRREGECRHGFGFIIESAAEPIAESWVAPWRLAR